MATEILPVIQQDAPSERGRSSRRLPIIAGVVVLLLVAGLAAWFFQAQQGAAHVAQGVQAAGVPVAGLTEQQAQAAIETRFAGLADSPLTLRGGGKSWTLTAHDLGLSLDSAGMAQTAHAAGRNGNPATVPLALTRNRATAEAALRPLAADVAAKPQDAHFTVTSGGAQVTSAQAGRQLDLDGTWAALTAATQQYPFGQVDVKLAEIAPQVTDQMLAPALATLHKLTDKPLTLTAIGSNGSPRTWTLDPKQLRAWLVVSQNGKGPATVQNTLDDAKVKSYLQALAPDLHLDPQSATLNLPDYATSTVLKPDVAGRDLDIAASLDLVQQAAQAGDGQRSVNLVMAALPAPVTAATLQPLKDQLDTDMREGLSLNYGDKTYQLKGTQVATAIYIEAAPGQPVPYKLTVNDKDTARLAASIAAGIDQPAQNAVYRMVDGAIVLARQPHDGFKVDQAQTAAAIKDALLNNQRQTTMTAGPTKPEYGATDQAASIQTPDLLSSDHTYYGGSSAERNWNVTLGGSKLDGWLIAPGSTFSLNDVLGDLTLQAGFKMGWAIQVEGGSVTTIPAEAGGICQVATTLFHPVFWAGLPMVERHHHSYWISLYGMKPLGMQGLDATISPPYSDFKFKNTTGNWLMIRAHGDHTNLYVELWGTNPGWRVQVSGPVVTNVVYTSQAPVYETSDKLHAGQTVGVEHAQNGFTSDIHRIVYDGSGNKIDDWHAQGTYLPSHNRFVKGTGH